MKEKTLLILAAGLGSRYGGCKQVDGFGPNKEFIMDYSIYDAIESGFTKVVFLIKRDMLETIENTIAKRIKNKMKVEYAFQEMNNIPSGVVIPEDRVKPWGTAHAIYCCKDAIHEPFVMINADDFYGRESYKEISKYLDNIKPNNIGIVGYKAKNTMSELGSVKRGVCTVKNNKVKDIVESELRYTDGKIEARPLNGTEFHLIDDEAINLMKDGVMLVNTSRGGLIDVDALIRGLRANKFHAVALDVYEGEDTNVYTDHSDDMMQNSVVARLVTFPNLVLTSHQAFFTREALQAIAAVTMENARNYNEGFPYGQAEVK